MDVHEALRTRSSIRAFRSVAVPESVLERVVSAALHSPSWANTQPYKLAVATGELCDRLRAEMLAATGQQMPDSDHPLLFDYPPELQARRRATGYGLYAAMGIERHDTEGRTAHFRRNFAF